MRPRRERPTTVPVWARLFAVGAVGLTAGIAASWAWVLLGGGV